MIFSIVLGVLILIGLNFYYQKVYLTKKKMIEYKAQFEKAGYRVRLDPFELYKCKMLDNYKQNQTKYGNPLYDKIHNFPNYDVVICSFLNRPFLEIINPDLLQSFFTSPITQYHKFRPLLQNIERAVGAGLVSSQNDIWRRKRRVMSTIFHFDFLSLIVPKAVEICNQVFDEFDKEQPQAQKIMHVKNTFMEILGNVVVQSFFGCTLHNERINGQKITSFLTHLIQDLFQQSTDPFALLFGVKAVSLGIRQTDRNISQRVKMFREIAQKVIRNRVQVLKKQDPHHQSHIKNGDVIQQLFLNDKLHETASGTDTYSYSEVIQQFCTFYSAGTDTSSYHLTMLILYISRYPQIKQKMLKQIEETFKTDQDITSENLKNLIYTEAVMKETHRMYGPGISIFTRQAVCDTKLKEINVSRGTLINPEFLPNNYNPAYFPDPYTFKPERWIQNKSLVHPYSFIPFSSGLRNCIGQHFSIMMQKIVLSKLFLRYRFTVDHPESIPLVWRFVISPDTFDTKVTNKDNQKNGSA